jgi:hypothetical protein
MRTIRNKKVYRCDECGTRDKKKGSYSLVFDGEDSILLELCDGCLKDLGATIVNIINQPQENNIRDAVSVD